MHPVVQLLNAIPGFQGSVQNYTRDSLPKLIAGGHTWVPDFIREMTAAGWL